MIKSNREKVRDHLWLWGHEAGSHNWGFGLFGADRMKLAKFKGLAANNPNAIPGPSRITPTEAAHYLGTPNLVMVVMFDQPVPPFSQYGLPMRSLSRVVWSTRTPENPDLEAVLALSKDQPNLVGMIMDDFFNDPDAQGKVAPYSVAEIVEFRRRLRQEAAHPLDLWVVVYGQQLAIPQIQPYLAEMDVITLWAWSSEQDLKILETLAPKAHKMLGIYMWGYQDYGGDPGGAPIPLEHYSQQCETGLKWLREGRIDGMIFLASCICDLGLETVEWTRKWIAEVGDKGL